MLVHAHLDRAIKDERLRTFRRLQRFQQGDGPDLAPVCQPDSELTPPAPRHNTPVHQLTVFRTCARHLTTTPVFQLLTSPPAVGLPGWSTVAWPAHSGRRWPEHEVDRSPRPVASPG